MYVTDRLVFIHLHKSGGTFVNRLLRDCVPGARQIGYHLPYREHPPEYRALPVIGTVRNPWAFYVSWYHFQRSLARPNALFRTCSNAGTLDFAQTARNLIGLHSDEGRLALLEAVLPERFGGQGLNLTRACVAELRGSGLGFYSFLYRRMYAGANAPAIVRVEALRDGLREALLRVGHLPDPLVERFLVEAPPRNVSQHDAPHLYYDDRLSALVSEADRYVIERHGYAP